MDEDGIDASFRDEVGVHNFGAVIKCQIGMHHVYHIQPRKNELCIEYTHARFDGARRRCRVVRRLRSAPEFFAQKQHGAEIGFVRGLNKRAASGQGACERFEDMGAGVERAAAIGDGDGGVLVAH